MQQILLDCQEEEAAANEYEYEYEYEYENEYEYEYLCIIIYRHTHTVAHTHCGTHTVAHSPQGQNLFLFESARFLTCAARTTRAHTAKGVEEGQEQRAEGRGGLPQSTVDLPCIVRGLS